MASFAKVEEDELVEKMVDVEIKEEGIPEVKLSFPFGFEETCVMKIVRNN
jgi:hypothetical protein